MQTVFELVNLGSDAVNIEWRIRHREADMLHRGVITARRKIDDARRLMDDKAEQLKAVGELATMMAFFAVSAFCEIRIPEETDSTVILLFGFLNAVVISLSMIATLSTIYMLVALYKFDCTSREDPVADLQGHWNDHFEQHWKIAFHSFILSVVLFVFLFSQAAWVVFWRHDLHFHASSIVTLISVITFFVIYFRLYIKWWDALAEVWVLVFFCFVFLSVAIFFSF